MSLSPGDLILVKGVGWIDRDIESISHSPYSHVAGVISGRTLIEAQGFRKTGYQNLSTYDGLYDVFVCDELTVGQRKIIVDYAISEVGTSYRYFLILWELIRYKLHWLLPLAKSRNSDCSVLWYNAYLKAGIDLCPGIKYPSPGDIANSKKLRRLLP